MLTDSEWAMVAKQFRLSPRELEVTRGIFAGRKHAAIAIELKMSRHTLNSHWRRVKSKLQLGNSGGAGRIQVIHHIYRAVIQGRD
ncbi:MAG: LuxR C-terminal-related transcriptional regulator [Phycisphaerales bacterium]|nr:LuxR C-terminal-related transcriptional regulator [Phycisphaerales bacterium]